MNFILYLISMGTSTIGSHMQTIIIPIYILNVTGSGLAMSKAATYFTLIRLVLTPLGGVVADKFNRKHIMILTDIINALVVGGFTLFLDLTPNTIILMQCIVLAMTTFFGSACSAIFSEITSEDNLDKENSIFGASQDFIMLFTPILAVTLYGFMGIKLIFMINSLTFFISAGVEFILKYKPTNTDNKKIELSPKALLDSYAPVARYLKEKKDIFGLMSFGVILNLFFTPVVSVFIPYFILNVLSLSNQYVGYFQSIMGVGFLLGSVLMVKYIKKYNFRKGIAFFITAELLIFTFFFSGNRILPFNIYLLITCLLASTFGIFNSAVNIPLSSHLHTTIETEIKGRFFSIMQVSMQGFTPIGLMIMGLAIDKYNDISVGIVAVGLVYILAIFYYFHVTKPGKLYIAAKA